MVFVAGGMTYSEIRAAYVALWLWRLVGRSVALTSGSRFSAFCSYKVSESANKDVFIGALRLLSLLTQPSTELTRCGLRRLDQHCHARRICAQPLQP